MTEPLQHFMDKAWTFVERGYGQEALKLCEKCLQVYPEQENEIWFEIAKIYYKNGNERKALELFFSLYQKTGIEDVCSCILENYYYNKKDILEQKYEENCKILNTNKYFYGKQKTLPLRYYLIYIDENQIYYYDKVERKFGAESHIELELSEINGKVVLCNDMLWIEDILAIEKRTRKSNPLIDHENPLLIVYQEYMWELFMQLVDLQLLLDFDRILLFNDISFMELYLITEDITIPEVIGANSLKQRDEFRKILENVYLKRIKNKDQYRDGLIKYYKENASNIEEHIRNKKPKILFITTRFSTAIQYHMMNCMRAAERMGIDTELSIEKARFHEGGMNFRLKQILEFKPDIIFQADHFRFEYSVIEELDALVYVTWVQDPIQHVMNRETIKKLGKRDIILNHYISWDKFAEVGYNEKQVIDAPIPADQYIYKIYQLDSNEFSKYRCDLCFVCHASDVDLAINNHLKKYSEDMRDVIQEIYRGYQEFVYITGNCFYNQNDFRRYIVGVLRQKFQLMASDELLDILTDFMFYDLNQRVFRQALVDWLLDAGYENIKLWGNGWTDNPKYAKYAMGTAENGETLSKIYQASKIVLGNNVSTTAAARAWEAMLSGAFYMSNYIPPEDDIVDIRRIMKADEEVVMFYDREDLLKKVDYYLNHEEERKKMAEIGRKVALEKMTFDILMEKVIKEIPERLQLLEQEEG